MSDLKLSVTPYEAGKTNLINFRNANRSEACDERYFDWRYIGSPSSFKPTIVSSETLQGEKIGSVSLIPRLYLIDNQVCSLGVVGDLSVVKDWRGKGVARQMLTFLAGQTTVKNLKACIVLPNVDALRPLETTGWRTVTQLHRYVKFLDTGRRIAELCQSPPIAKAIAFCLNQVLRFFTWDTYLVGRKGLEARLETAFDDRFDTLWNEARKHDMVIGMRDRKTLAWRYLEHPIIRYRIYTLTDFKKLCGYIIFHMEEATCFIDDIFYLNERGYSAYLLGYFSRYARTNKIGDSIVIKMNRNHLSPSLLQFGFIRRADHQHLMIHADSTSKGNHLLLTGSCWFLTSGDKDV